MKKPSGEGFVGAFSGSPGLPAISQVMAPNLVPFESDPIDSDPIDSAGSSGGLCPACGTLESSMLVLYHGWPMGNPDSAL